MKQFISERIKFNEIRIEELKEESISLKQQIKDKVGIEGVEKWEGYTFVSSSGTTEEFKAFVKDFRKYIKANIPDGAELKEFNKMHFEVSGFIKRGSKFVYFNLGDVRSRDGWYNNVLIRTAEDEKDFTGGINGFTSLKDFKKNVDYLLR